MGLNSGAGALDIRLCVTRLCRSVRTDGKDGDFTPAATPESRSVTRLASLSPVADPKGQEVHVCCYVSTQGSLKRGTHPNWCLSGILTSAIWS
jgi:hypothetical protein